MWMAGFRYRWRKMDLAEQDNTETGLWSMLHWELQGLKAVLQEPIQQAIMSA